MDAFVAIVLYLVLVNLWSYWAFRADKQRATIGDWRIPESRLLALALMGGWAGAKIGQRRFRHKTRKQPFGTLLNIVPIVWVMGIMLMTLAAGPIRDAGRAVFATGPEGIKVHRPPVVRRGLP